MQVHDSLSEMTAGICTRFEVDEPDRTRVDRTFAAARQQRIIDESQA